MEAAAANAVVGKSDSEQPEATNTEAYYNPRSVSGRWEGFPTLVSLHSPPYSSAMITVIITNMWSSSRALQSWVCRPQHLIGDMFGCATLSPPCTCVLVLLPIHRPSSRAPDPRVEIQHTTGLTGTTRCVVVPSR